mmetsp:Transcript_53259/g.134574  ORF Transcript_53259/g.134574 Transcript_53259/m.134574 type:complete len:233 (-) Transcript_53259:66-764(-)
MVQEHVQGLPETCAPPMTHKPLGLLRTLGDELYERAACVTSTMVCQAHDEEVVQMVEVDALPSDPSDTVLWMRISNLHNPQHFLNEVPEPQELRQGHRAPVCLEDLRSSPLITRRHWHALLPLHLPKRYLLKLFLNLSFILLSPLLRVLLLIQPAFEEEVNEFDGRDSAVSILVGCFVQCGQVLLRCHCAHLQKNSLEFFPTDHPIFVDSRFREDVLDLLRTRHAQGYYEIL